MKKILNISQLPFGISALLLFACLFCSLRLTSQETPQLEYYSLKNGLKVYLISHGKLEAINVSLIINSGKKNEIPGQQGYNDLVADLVLRGNKKFSREEQNNKAFAIGSSLSGNAGLDFTTLNASCLSKDSETIFDLLSAAVKEPLFEKETVDQYISYLMSYNTPSKMDISMLAFIYGELVVHGTDNPLGRQIYKEQLKQVTVEKIKTFHQFNYTPGNTRIVITGRFNKEEIKKLVETYFGNWQSTYGEVNGVELDMPSIKKKETYFVNRSGATQCALRWIKIAPSIKDKDELAFEIANSIFNNVLFQEIREKGGKTYGINSFHSISRFANLMQISCSVRSSEMLNTMNLFDKTLADFSLATFTQEEFINEIAQFRANLNSMEYPSEISAFYNPLVYDFNSRKNVMAALEKLTVEDVRRVIKKYFTPGIYKLVIAGDETSVTEQFSKIKDLKKLAAKDLVEWK